MIATTPSLLSLSKCGVLCWTGAFGQILALSLIEYLRAAPLYPGHGVGLLPADFVPGGLPL